MTVLALLLAALTQAQPNLFPLGDCEGQPVVVNDVNGTAKAEIRGTLASGWHDNSNWAPVKVDYEVRTDTPHGGRQYQRIVARAVDDGRVQLVTYPPKLEPGAVYELRAWLRSPTGTGATLMVRQPGAPYHAYAEQAVAASGEWQSVRLRVPSPGALPVYLMVLLDAPGTLDLDDVSWQVVGSGEEVSDAAPQTGQLAPQTRLGMGVPGGWHAEGQQWQLAAETADGPRGPGAARLTLGQGGRLVLSAPPRFLRFGVVHTAALWVRAEPATSVRLELLATDSNRGLHGSRRASPEWQRLSVRGKVPLTRDERLYLQVTVTGGPATVWLDGLSLREGEATDGPDDARCGLALTPGEPWGVFTGDQPLTVKVGAVGAPAGARLSLTLTHVNGQTAAQTLPLADQLALTDPLCRLRGVLRVVGTLVDAAGQPLSPPSETLLARVPEPLPGDRPDSPFGTHVMLREPDLTAVARLGFKHCRLHDASILTKWALVEPQPGHWVWYDAEMKLARDRGLTILGMLCSSPTWASGHEQEQGYFSIYYPPKDLAAWRRYVRTVVAHYKGVIDRWEVWNEPWGNGAEQGFFRGGTPQQYAELLKAAYEEAKAANPTCTILGIDTYPRSWDEQVLAAGTYRSFDVLSFHRYESSLGGGPQDVFGQVAERLRREQEKYGPARPLEDSEGGPGTTDKGSFLSFADRRYDGDWSRWADQVPRYYLGCLAAGVKRYYLYTLHAESRFARPGNWALTEPGWLVKPLTVAVSVLASFVDGAQWQARLTPAAGASAHWFARADGGAVALLVSDGESAVDLPRALPAGTRCYDRWGNACDAPRQATRSIVYLTADRAGAAALRAALQ